MKSLRWLVTISTLVMFGIIASSNSPVKAEESETVSVLSWLEECRVASTPPTGDLVKMIQAKGRPGFVWSKKDSTDFNYALSIYNFNCEELTEEFWSINGAEIKANLAKAKTILESFYRRYTKSIPITISCYKAGVIKKVTGSKPICPKGFKQIKG